MPQVKDGPAELNKKLEEVYSACMANSKDEKMCSAVAWKQAKRDGWFKNGSKWMRRGSKRV